MTRCPVHAFGPDVVYLGAGEYIVLEDNVRVPSGVAYSGSRLGLAELGGLEDGGLSSSP